MKKIFSGRRGRYLSEAAVTFLLGLSFVLFPMQSLQFLGYLLGAAFMAYGVFVFLGGMRRGVSSVLVTVSVLFVLLGVVCFFYSSALLTFFLYVIAFFIILRGAIYLSYTYNLYQNRYRYWWVQLIFAVLLLALGFYIMFNPGGVQKTVLILLGIMLIVNAFENLARYTRTRRGS